MKTWRKEKAFFHFAGGILTVTGAKLQIAGTISNTGTFIALFKKIRRINFC